MSKLPPRLYGVWTGTFVVAASMVGSGILTVPGQTLRATESPGTLFLVWIIGGIMALCGALSVAELGASLPHAGGDYVFVRHAFGNAWAFVFGWCCLMFTFAGPIAVIAVLIVDYLKPPGFNSSGVLGLSIASSIILVFTVVHSLGQKESAWVQNVTTLVKLIIFVAFVAWGFFAGTGSLEHFTQGEPIAAKGGWGTLAIQMTLALYAYSGWNGAAYLAGEMRDPQRTLPRSLVGGTLLVMSLYLAMNAVYLFAVPPTTLAEVSEDQSRVIAWLAGERLFGGNLSRGLSIVFGIGMLATISALLFTGPRIAFMMARDGLIPEFMGRLDPVRQTPTRSTILLGLIAMGLLWSGRFEQILEFTSVGLTALSGLTVASIFPLRARSQWQPRFRTPFYPWPPILFIALTAVTVVLAVQGSPSFNWKGYEWVNVSWLSIGSILIGFPIYWAYVLLAGRPRSANLDEDLEIES